MRTILVLRTGMPGTWREKLAGITAFTKTEGWRVQTIDARTTLPDIPHLIEFWQPDGIILDASGHTGGMTPSTFSHVPSVCMTPSSDTFGKTLSLVRSSSREVANIAARELLRREVKTLAYIDAPGRPSWSTEKREAFRDVAALHGFRLSVVTSARELAKLTRPIGLFVATDALAAEALVIAEHLGIRVPDDLSVVGVDDDPEICESCTPTLSSVRPDFHRLGFTAATLLKRRLDSPRRKIESVEIPPIGLARRASSDVSADAGVSRALEAIRLHACEGLSVPAVAALFGPCSRRNAELRFKAATGKTMTDALLDARLARACNYLKEGRMSVAAVADFCGWKSDVAFRKAFKKRFNRLPSSART